MGIELFVCPLCVCMLIQLCLTLCDPKDCSPDRLLCPWNSPGKNTGVGCHFLLQGIFPIQGSNPHLLHWQVGSLPHHHLGSPLYESLTILLLSFGSVVTSPLPFLILVICVFSTFVLCQYS